MIKISPCPKSYLPVRQKEIFSYYNYSSSTSTSSSPSSYSHFYVGSMYDDIRLQVARSFTSSPDSPFSLVPSFTLSNHLLLGLPLFLLPCTYISIALLPMYWSSFLITCPYHFNLLSWTLFMPPLFVPLILSLLVLSSVAFTFLWPTIVSLSLLRCPCLCPVNQCRSYQCPVHFPIDLHVNFPVHPLALHSVGDFRIQFSILRQHRYQVCECLHSLTYCLSL